jgi:hypothetical protein
MARVGAIVLAAAVFGCAPSSPAPASPPAPAPRVPEPAPVAAPAPPEPEPSASAALPTPSAEPSADAGPPALAALPPSLTCKHGAGPAVKSLRKDKTPPPAAGQMTEEAAQAKRLFDGEHWKDALTSLERVWNGDTGDDEGNRQLAEYHRAIALYRLGRMTESYAAFRAIATKRSHLKRHETLLWLVKFAHDHADLLALADFAAYDVEDAKRFDNAMQGEIFAIAAYLLGRERIAEGAKAEARELLGHVPDSHPWSSDAKACLALAK